MFTKYHFCIYKASLFKKNKAFIQPDSQFKEHPNKEYFFQF